MPLTTETFHIVEVRPNEYWAGRLMTIHHNTEYIEQTTTTRLNLATSIRCHEWMSDNVPHSKERWKLMLKTYPQATMVEVKATYTV